MSTRAAIRDADRVFVSIVSAWEIAIKQGLGRLDPFIEKFDIVLNDVGCDLLGISVRHTVAVAGLPRHHADPFDRMMIAQAICEGLLLVTVDPMICRYDVPLLDRKG